MDVATATAALAAARVALPSWDALDTEALLTDLAAGGALSATRDAGRAALHAAFLRAGFDSPATEEEAETDEGGGDDGNEDATLPPKVVPETRFSDALYAILEAAVSAPPGAPTLGTAEAAPSPPTLARLLATLHVLKAGWGAAALRFAVACAQAQEGEPLCTADGGDGGVGEAALWTAVTWAALPPSSAGGGPWGESWGSGGALPIPPALRAHLRVAWRSCELLPPPPPDDGGLGADGAGGEQAQGDAEEGDASGAAEEEEEGGGRATGGGAGEALGAAGVESQQQQQRQQGGAAAGAAPPPAAARVSVDDFVARVAGDAVLAWVWARDAAVPEARAAATA